jgi:signal transduction histidine kinase
VVRINDTGVGISQDELARIFEMFVRARTDDTRGGLGIGLALARTLARLHGGEIRAHSAGPGQGSTFELVLPIHG